MVDRGKIQLILNLKASFLKKKKKYMYTCISGIINRVLYTIYAFKKQPSIALHLDGGFSKKRKELVRI